MKFKFNSDKHRTLDQNFTIVQKIIIRYQNQRIDQQIYKRSYQYPWMFIRPAIIFFLFLYAVVGLYPHRHVTILENPILTAFSAHQKYLAVANKTKFQIFEGLSGKKVMDMNLPQGYHAISFITFSEDQNKVGVGYSAETEEEVKASYYNIQNKFQIQGQAILQSHQLSNQANLISCKGLVQFKNVFVSVTEKVVTAHLQSSKIVEPQFGVVTAIEKMYEDQIQFVKAVISSGLRIEFEEINIQSSRFIHDGMKAVNGFNISKINDLYLSEDKQNLYFVGDSSIVYRMSMTTWDIDKVLDIVDSRQLISVVASNNADVIYSYNKTNVFVAQKFNSSQNGEYNITTKEISVPSVAFTKSGGNLFFISQNQSQIWGICKENQYLEDNLRGSFCKPCGKNCELCLHNGIFIQCKECISSYFLKNDSCNSCSVHCLNCQSQKVCSKCAQPYLLLNSQCGCPEGKYDSASQCLSCQNNCKSCENQNQCIQCFDGYYGSSCSSITMLVLIIVFSILLLVLIIVCILYRCKNSRRKDNSILVDIDPEGQAS